MTERYIAVMLRSAKVFLSRTYALSHGVSVGAVFYVVPASICPVRVRKIAPRSAIQ